MYKISKKNAFNVSRPFHLFPFSLRTFRFCARNSKLYYLRGLYGFNVALYDLDFDVDLDFLGASGTFRGLSVIFRAISCRDFSSMYVIKASFTLLFILSFRTSAFTLPRIYKKKHLYLSILAYSTSLKIKRLQSTIYLFIYFCLD